MVRFVHVLFKNIQGNPKTFEREQSDLNVRTKSPDNMYTETLSVFENFINIIWDCDEGSGMRLMRFIFILWTALKSKCFEDCK